MADKEQIKPRITPADWLCNENNYRFKVPVYQRLFAWDTPQFDRLLSDLQEWDNNKPYYFGIITVVKQKNEQGDTYILIDGQQRLTVIAILMGLFKDDKFCITPITNCLDYEARQNDRKALEKIWEIGNGWLGCGIKDELNKKMDENQIVNESMRSFIRHVWERKSEWKDIIDKQLFNRLKLLISCLPDNYEEELELQNEYFEKMNSAGKQLEPHEILKVQICKDENDFETWNIVEDFTKKYAPLKDQTPGTGTNKYETTIENIINKNLSEETKNKLKSLTDTQRASIEKWRPSLIDFPTFLLHVLKLHLHLQPKDTSRFNIDSHSLLKKFEGQDIIKNDESSGFVDLMCKYRKFLDEWVIHKDVDSCEQQDIDDENNSDVSRYSYWGSGEKSMEIKYISSNDIIVSKELKQIQMALSAVGDQKQEWIIDAFIWHTGKDISPKDLLCYHVRQLVSQFINKGKEYFIADKTEWPDDFMTYNNHIPRALFVCLDYFLWLLAKTENDQSERWKLLCKIYGEDFSEGTDTNVADARVAITSFVPKAHRSVEHFHPQTDEYSTNKKEWSEAIENISQSKKDMFGNLALISAGRNSEYGNYSVEEKSARINRLINQKNLESIKLYLMMKECNKKDEEWTPSLAHKHAQDMLEVLKWGIKHYNIDIDQIKF